MSKTVKEIALALNKDKKELVKEKQRVRDEIKRQHIETKKVKNRFVVSDIDANKIIEVLKKKNEDNSNKSQEFDDLNELVKKWRAQSDLLKKENERLNEENQRLNSKIEKYADDFKDLNDKQLQLNNQQQQLQARILEQTNELKSSQEKLIELTQNSSQLEKKVEKVENASFWQRLTGHFEYIKIKKDVFLYTSFYL